jgi:Putative beta-barrel porin-2, OmpL-like. bbp2
MSRIAAVLFVTMLLVALAGAAGAQTPAAPAAPAAPAPEAPKTLFEELVFFGYLENSYVFNLKGVVDGPNELRVYDAKSGYTFNIGELSVKKDPSDRYPFGFGLVITGGEDSQKNHALGLFRSSEDTPSDTIKFDIQEAYLSYRLPVGTGLTLKGGKFVTLLGYETIEAPNNLNFSRSFLFGFATPLTNTGLLASYAVTDTLSVTAGRSSAGTWSTPGTVACPAPARSPSRRPRSGPPA